MVKPLLVCAILAGFLFAGFPALTSSSAQQMGTIASKHVMLQISSERELLARELTAEIERCYEFMNRSINGSLPRKILIAIDWNLSESRCNFRSNSITIGMNQPAALMDEKGFLFHSIAREIARLGLLELSQGAEREDTEFLFEGMIEILVHEFDHSSRIFDAAWATSRMLDDMQMLGFAQQRSWSSFSQGNRNHRNAAPGITFMLMFRDLQNRDRPLKLFESLRQNSLLNGLSLAFKAPAAELESAWLKRVREYEIPNELNPKAGDVPHLVKAATVPAIAKAGAPLLLKLFIEDKANDLIAQNIFVKDERSGRLFQAQSASGDNEQFFVITIPIDANCVSGQYSYQVTAIDESGNLQRWTGRYSVGS